MLTGHIIQAIESFAPPALQESYDNSGLILGNRLDECTGALITVDVTPEVVDEAISLGYNLIVAHHPLIFKGIKRLTGKTPQERAVISAIRHGIAVYACHTSLDSARGGVSQRMASMLGLGNVKPLDPTYDKLLKLQTFVPDDYLEDVRLALFDAGAGAIGNYDMCSYSVSGEGTFRANESAEPFVGEIGEIHHEKEHSLQVILPEWKRQAVESALLTAHPYEEPAYEFIRLQNTLSGTGLGAIGNFETPVSPTELIGKIKETFGSPIVRCTSFDNETPIRRLALCGGSGSSLIPNAIAGKAQAYLTSDVKYHDFVDYGPDILLIDIGHHESENCSKNVIYDIISEKFPNFALRNSKADVNPINYL